MTNKLSVSARDVEMVLKETALICGIPAPTFSEETRAAYVLRRMKAIGLSTVLLSTPNNVMGELISGKEGPTILVSAHLDTVFSADTPIKVQREKSRLFGPGIGDNCLGVATLLWLAEKFRFLGLPAAGKIVFAANSGEEGLGNLTGMRALMAGFRIKPDAVIVLEGHGQDGFSYDAVGSIRIEATFRAKGGHSWVNFGQPSAILAIGDAISSISKIKVPKSPRTTFNVGTITGGTGVNVIASEASMLVDMRSVDGKALSALDKKIRQIIKDAARRTKTESSVIVVGNRPSGSMKRTHPLCKLVAEVRKKLKLPPAKIMPASTDANIPLSQGIPAICLGITKGDFSHTINEYIETKPVKKGLEQLAWVVSEASKLSY